MNTIFILPSIIAIIAWIVYIKYIYQKSIIINLSTRIIRLFIEIINIISYFKIVEDKIKVFIAIGAWAVILMIVIVWLYQWRFKKINRFDRGMFIIGIIAIIVWIITKSYIVTNILLQIWFIVWYLPTVIWIYQWELKEKILPWVIWGAWALIGLIGLIIYYESRFSLIYPSVWIAGNIAIIIAIVHQKSQKKH